METREAPAQQSHREQSFSDNPILVEVTRGDGIESVHRGAVAVVDARGDVVESIGNIDAVVFPRSAAKMFQAIPLIESGAADRFGLANSEVALACASHSGEEGHVRAVERWLARLGLANGALGCGSHVPFNEDAAAGIAAERRRATPFHNNCSGKHAGFLTIAAHLGFPLVDYTAPSHPVQQRVTATLAELTEFELANVSCGIDGCGVPAHSLPLRCLAHAAAKLGSPQALAPQRKEAANRIVGAMLAHPWMVGGTKRFDTRAIEAGEGRFLVKMGAEGVHVAVLLDRRLGIALKIDDGASRAAEVAMTGVLQRFGAMAPELVLAFMPAPILNNLGEQVGAIRPAGMGQ